MARSEGQKLKLLYLRDYLRQNTNESHPASAATLIAHLQSKGIRAERKSIYDDIQALEQYGMEIHHRSGAGGGYYVTDRDFELPELKLLVDAVLSSRFLSGQRSAALIRKLAALSNAHEAELLRRQVVLSGRVKTENEAGLANVDLLHEAIGRNAQVTFRYFDWGVDRKKHFRDGLYTASPIALCWDDENYYLVAHTQRHGLTHYRVDKMADICITSLPRELTDEVRAFDPAAYSREVFGMFRGQRQKLKLRFENALAGVVIDRFGTESLLIPDGKEHFTVQVTVSVSPNFLGWIAGFGGRASIVYPMSAVENYRQFCLKALEALPKI